MAVIKDLGAATAYGYARSKGYTGTEEEFAELMASYAEVGQSAAESAQEAAAARDVAVNAKNDAQTARDAAQSAQTAAESARDTATARATAAATSADQASGSATAAAGSASTASAAAQTATTKASEAATSAQTASTAKTDAETAQAAAETAQVAAETAADGIEQAAAQIETNTQDITNLKADILLKPNFIHDTASGAIASFPDGADSQPIQSLVAQIEPVQSGSGDPSPDNVRPITGWTGLTLTHSGADASEATTISVSWETEAGTVYGGSLDVVSGELVAEYELEVFNEIDAIGILLSKINSFNKNGASVSTIDDYTRISFTIRDGVDQSKYNRISSTYTVKMCNIAPHLFSYNDQSTHWYRNTILYLTLPTSVVGSTSQSVYDYLVSIKDENPLTLAIPLATPKTYQLSAQEITTLLGQNHVSVDTGNVSVTYPCDLKLYIDKKIAELATS